MSAVKEVGVGQYNKDEMRDFLVPLLKERTVEVTFTKADGSNRVMDCTLNEKYLPDMKETGGATKQRKHNDEVLAVWSVKDSGWRSFRLDSVNSIKFSVLDGE